MDIIYTREAIEYKGNEMPEGKYRLEGIHQVGRKVDPDVDGLSKVRLIHSEEHIRQVQKAGERSAFLAEVHTDGETFQAAVRSAGLAWYAARRGHFACTRPPGHHATTGISKGFCFFNNMAIVTRALLNMGHKVCILDIDGHQGDGTEQIYYDSDEVLFFSIHQEFVYPYYGQGYHTGNDYDRTVDRHGKNAGEGFTCNIPVPAKSGDDVLLGFLKHYLPRIREFGPDYIGISAGFDGYQKDALLNLNYSQHGYYKFGQAVEDLGAETFAVLEGGYHRDVVECTHALVNGLNNKEYPSDQERTSSSEEILSRFNDYLKRADLL